MSTCGIGVAEAPVYPGDPVFGTIVLTATAVRDGILLKWGYPGTNPNAVAHIIIYRGLDLTFGNASEHAKVSASEYLDKSNVVEGTMYYYWIRMVSVNGTESPLYGPASALMMPPIAAIIDDLTGQITSTKLHTDLQTQIDKIPQIIIDLDDEIASRLIGQTALDDLWTALNATLGDLDTLVQNEVIERIEGNTAMVTEIGLIAAKSDNNAAAILNESIVRADEYSALAQDLTILTARTDDNEANIINEQFARTTQYDAMAADVLTLETAVSDLTTGAGATSTALSALTSRVSIAEGEITTHTAQLSSLTSDLITANGNIAANASAASTLDTRVTAAEGNISSVSTDLTSLTNTVNDGSTGLAATAAGLTSLTTTVNNHTGLIGANAIYAAQIEASIVGVGGVEERVSAEETLTVEIFEDLDGPAGQPQYGLRGQYMVKLDVNGYVSGFGLSSTDKTSNFIVHADSFSVGIKNGDVLPGGGGTAASDQVIYPFIIGNVGGVPKVVMTNALIADLSVTRAKIDDLAVNDAKIAALAVTEAKIAALAVGTANIQDGAVENAKIGNVIQSTNYVADTSGWKIDKAGTAEFQNVKVRGDIEATSIKAGEVIVSTSTIQSNAVTVPSFAASPANSTDVPAGLNSAHTITVDFGSNPALWPTNVLVTGMMNFLDQGSSGAATVALGLVQGTTLASVVGVTGSTVAANSSIGLTCAYLFGPPTTQHQTYTLVSNHDRAATAYHYGERNLSILGAKR